MADDGRLSVLACSRKKDKKASLMYLGSYRPVLEPHPHHTSTSNINLEELGADNNRDGQSPKHPRRGPLIV
ncbi:hypothetical protein INR49_027254 [Caranx melampygus]|nr:hypothetical protein INR49_027254 [Caranx melampygus]